AWASTVHAFQGRTVDNVIAVMEAKHPKLSTQKSFYVEISRARHSAELVTDDAKALRETLEAATGERVSALEGIGAAEKALSEEKARGSVKERGRGLDGMPERAAGNGDDAADKGRDIQPEPEVALEPKQKSVEMDFGL
ncbi:MAG: helicase C-terminal domain-containing protein, partial [Boseongicola sp.]|nr:helicase C-terminal domain-containing protein [Boseongicola sp.]